MSINPSPKNLKKFQAYRRYLKIVENKIENNGNNGSSDASLLASHDDVMDFLMSRSPIDKEVENFMRIEETKIMTDLADDIEKSANTIKGGSK